MEHPNFFVYLAIDLLVVSVVAMILRRILAIYGRKKHSKKQLESFLANLAESYYKAYYKHGFSSNGSNMRKSIERDMSSKFNYLFSYLPYFPKSFDKDYIDKEAGLFVDRMIPVLEFLHASTLTDKASRPTIQTLQKIFFDRMEIEIINHLHSSIGIMSYNSELPSGFILPLGGIFFIVVSLRACPQQKSEGLSSAKVGGLVLSKSLRACPVKGFLRSGRNDSGEGKNDSGGNQNDKTKYTGLIL